MNDIRPYEGIIAEQLGERLSDQTRLSIFELECRTEEVGSHHVILLQEAESHFHEIAETAAEHVHLDQDADQVILFHRHTFELDGVA